MARAIVLNSKDNVATLIDSSEGASECALRGHGSGTIKLTDHPPYGHKVALRDIAEGEEILKYGTVIGRAVAAIPVGGHVHVHNVESLRGRGDKNAKE